MAWTNRISVARGAFYGGVCLSGTYILCALLDLLFPNAGMIVGWALLLPRMTGLVPASFLTGAVGSFLIGALFLGTIAPTYNLYFILRDRIDEVRDRRYNDRLNYF